MKFEIGRSEPATPTKDAGADFSQSLTRCAISAKCDHPHFGFCYLRRATVTLDNWSVELARVDHIQRYSRRRLHTFEFSCEVC